MQKKKKNKNGRILCIYEHDRGEDKIMNLVDFYSKPEK